MAPLLSAILGGLLAWSSPLRPSLPPSRSAVAAMKINLPAPPAPPPTHTDKGYGGGDGFNIMLTDVCMEEKTALLSVWKFLYEQEAEGDSTHRDVKAARFLSGWIGDQAPSGWLGKLKGRMLGMYIDGPGALKADALIAVRYERDSSDMKQLVLGRHVLVVDEMLLSPSIPQQVRGPVHAALLQCLVELGRFHNQKVLVWDDFHDPTGHFGI